MKTDEFDAIIFTLFAYRDFTDLESWMDLVAPLELSHEAIALLTYLVNTRLSTLSVPSAAPTKEVF